MLYFIRCCIAIAAGSSTEILDSNDTKKSSELPSEEGRILLDSARKVFRDLADDGAKGKKERGYLLGLLEIARESRRRNWDEGTYSGISSTSFLLIEPLRCSRFDTCALG